MGAGDGGAAARNAQGVVRVRLADKLAKGVALARAEQAIAGVAQSGKNVALLIEFAVE